MARSLSRFASLLVALGWLVSTAAAAPPPGNHSILIGPKACDVSIPVATISKMNKNVVWWNSADPDKELWIEFDEEIFKQMTPGKFGKFRVDCKKASCFSHHVSDSMRPDPTKEYKYWQVLAAPDSSIDKCDGRIIINP